MWHDLITPAIFLLGGLAGATIQRYMDHRHIQDLEDEVIELLKDGPGETVTEDDPDDGD